MGLVGPGGSCKKTQSWLTLRKAKSESPIMGSFFRRRSWVMCLNRSAPWSGRREQMLAASTETSKTATSCSLKVSVDLFAMAKSDCMAVMCVAM